MPIIKTASDENYLVFARSIFAESTYIDMHYKGSSTGPLYSDNFANCLAVIIHDEKTKSGCLMHIFPALGGGVDKTALFCFVDREIDEALKEFSTAENLSLFLLKGFSYTTQNKQLPINYGEHAKKIFKNKVNEIIEMMDHKGFTPEQAILYDPASFKIILIVADHSKFFDSKLLTRRSNVQLPILSPSEFYDKIVSNPNTYNTVSELNQEFDTAMAANKKQNEKGLNKFTFKEVKQELGKITLNNTNNSKMESQINNADDLPAEFNDNQESKFLGNYSFFADEKSAISNKNEMEAFFENEDKAEEIENADEIVEEDEVEEINPLVNVDDEDYEEKKYPKR